MKPNGHSFGFTKEMVDSALRPDPDAPTRVRPRRCVLIFSAATTWPREVPVVIEASEGTRNDIVRNPAIFKPNTIHGTAYWIDRGATDANKRLQPAAGLDITSTSRVITMFAPGSGVADDPTIKLSDGTVSTVTELVKADDPRCGRSAIRSSIRCSGG